MTKLLTISECAGILRVSRPTTLRLIRAGRLPAVRVGQRGQWRISENSIVELLRGKVQEEKVVTA